MSERYVRYVHTPHGWFGIIEPDWEQSRQRLAEQPEPTIEERLAASLRYVRALYDQDRGASPR